MIDEIAASSNEQSLGIGQVNTAMTQLDKVTQSNAAAAEESAGASEELTGQAQTMAGVVKLLLEIVGSRQQTDGAPAPAKMRHETGATAASFTEARNFDSIPHDEVRNVSDGNLSNYNTAA